MSNLNTNHVAERAELEAVLKSGIFQRAPSLAQFLTFVCEKHFAGEKHLIREFNIATEALGRGTDFNQKKDSIVRVEAHRLRKRLREFYESEGDGHAIQITLPPGGYTPQFTCVAIEAVPAATPAELVPVPGAVPMWMRWWPVAAVSAFVVVALTAVLLLQTHG